MGGWTEAALVEGAKDARLSPAIVGAFPRKEAALVEVGKYLPGVHLLIWNWNGACFNLWCFFFFVAIFSYSTLYRAVLHGGMQSSSGR
jgi:hypothetical protein